MLQLCVAQCYSADFLNFFTYCQATKMVTTLPTLAQTVRLSIAQAFLPANCEQMFVGVLQSSTDIVFKCFAAAAAAASKSTIVAATKTKTLKNKNSKVIVS